MSDWFRSITALGVAFVSVVVVTLGLADAMVSTRTDTANVTDGAGTDSFPVAGDPQVAVTIPGLGGTLTVTGDRQAELHLDHQADGPGFGLGGDDGRIFFGGSPLTVIQLNFDGLSFFPEADQCLVTPDNLANRIGIGTAELMCDSIVDIRGNGVITIAGTLGLPIDLLAVRQLPPSGGSVEVGGETWTFEDVTLDGWQIPVRGRNPEYNMRLINRMSTGPGHPPTLNFTYDAETRRLSLANVERDDAATDVPVDACDVSTRELGQHNPRTTVIEVSITCAEVDVPGLGLVPISGTVVVDRLEFPE